MNKFARFFFFFFLQILYRNGSFRPKVVSGSFRRRQFGPIRSVRRFGPGSFRLLVVYANFPIAEHLAHLYRYQRYAYPPYLPEFTNLPNDLHVPIYMYLPTYLATYLSYQTLEAGGEVGIP